MEKGGGDLMVQVITGLQSFNNIWIESLQEEPKLRCSAKEESMDWILCYITADERVCLVLRSPAQKAECF